jgi:hypothetical protein
MSGSRCTVCEHPQVAEISREFVEGEHLRSLEQKYAVSKSALSRHFREHTSNKALKANATVRRPVRKRRERLDVEDTLQQIAAQLQDALADNTSGQATAQLSGALVRVIEYLEKRETQNTKRSQEDGQWTLAKVFDSWSRERLLVTVGRCPREDGWEHCVYRLSCPKHGEITDKELWEWTQLRAVEDYGKAGGKID